MLKIVSAPEQILFQKVKPVKKIDKKILKIIKEMQESLNHQRNPKGVGLAAPQVGYPLKIFIAKPQPKSPIRVFINPEITWLSEELNSGIPERENPFEGCLSLPGVWGPVKRHASVKLRYQTPDGETQEEVFEDFMAVIIQHEMDHLEGRLFTQRILEQQGKLYKARRNEDGKEEMVAVDLT